MSEEELKKKRNEYSYTREYCLIFDSCIKASFYDSIERWELNKDEKLKDLENRGMYIKEILLMTNGRIALLLEYR